MTWDGRERRSSLQVSGPWGLRVVLVSARVILWVCLSFVVGLVAGLFVALEALKVIIR